MLKRLDEEVYFVYLLLDKVPLISNSQQQITGVSKHLCGAATGEYNNL
jgi:hypothetical protein